MTISAWDYSKALERAKRDGIMMGRIMERQAYLVATRPIVSKGSLNRVGYHINQKGATANTITPRRTKPIQS